MPKPRSGREPLSRERVIETALALADERGVEAVTVRGLARILGVEPMSLYHYAASRDEIVGAMVERVIAQIDLPPAGSDWERGIRACAISAHQVLRQHPWACNLLMAGPQISPGRLAMVDALLAWFEAADLPPQLADLAYHAVDSHILGFTLWEAGYTRGLPRLEGRALEQFLRDIHIERFPHLHDHALWHLRGQTGSRPNEFEFGLDLILDGVKRLRDDESWASAG